jgi:hypothetical protein
MARFEKSQQLWLTFEELGAVSIVFIGNGLWNSVSRA